MPLSLAVSLRVKDGEEPLFDAQKVVQRRLKLGHKYLAAVANNGVEQTVVLNYNIEDNFC